MADNKTKPTSASVDDFIAAIENSRRRADALIALAIYQEITGLPPVMWGPSIIGFGSHHFRYETGREGNTPAASFSPRKANMTFYVAAASNGAGRRSAGATRNCHGCRLPARSFWRALVGAHGAGRGAERC